MCLCTSFIATMLFKGSIRPGVFSTWVQTAALNFPMALLWQFFVAGPLARLIFREKKRKNDKKSGKRILPLSGLFCALQRNNPTALPGRVRKRSLQPLGKAGKDQTLSAC